MNTMVRTRKQATPERWQKALQRAQDEKLSIFKVSGSGQAVVTSGRDGATVYATDGVGCECEAALLGGDPVCKHRAIFWFEAGVLDLAASPKPCGWCDDGAMTEWHEHGRYVATTRGVRPVTHPAAVAVHCPKCGRPPAVREDAPAPTPNLRLIIGGRDDRAAA